MADVTTEQIRTVLAEHSLIPTPIAELDDESDLYRAGLTSHASVNVMLALEDALGVEFPDALLRKSTFQSIAAIREAVESLDVSA